MYSAISSLDHGNILSIIDENKLDFALVFGRVPGVLDDVGDDVLRDAGVDRGQPDVRRVLADAVDRLGDQVLGRLDEQGLVPQPGGAGGILTGGKGLAGPGEGVYSLDNQLTTYKFWIIFSAMG